jgi:hypothetical protein
LRIIFNFQIIGICFSSLLNPVEHPINSLEVIKLKRPQWPALDWAYPRNDFVVSDEKLHETKLSAKKASSLLLDPVSRVVIRAPLGARCGKGAEVECLVLACCQQNEAGTENEIRKSFGWHIWPFPAATC